MSIDPDMRISKYLDNRISGKTRNLNIRKAGYQNIRISGCRRQCGGHAEAIIVIMLKQLSSSQVGT
jgi:sulfite reductase beta subunit-like hemoprotein